MITILLAVYLTGCGQSVGSGEPKGSDVHLVDDVEDEIKERALRDSSNAAGVALAIEKRIDSESQAGGRLVYPVALAAIRAGGVYVSDNNAHRINYCPPNSDEVVSLPTQTGKGQLDWPNAIRIRNHSILVSDNDGIKFFKLDGTFQRLLRIYYQTSSFAVDTGGNIYGNPHFAAQSGFNPLIVKLNKEGTLIKGFGTRTAKLDHFGLDDKAFLCSAGKYLFVAFQHRPTVQVFDAEGLLLREFRVDHSSFPQLASLHNDERFVHPEPDKVRLPQYLAGASVVGDRLLVLLDQPSVQIVEFDFEGKELKRYSSDYQPFQNIRYRGFDAQLIGGNYRFWTIIGSRREHGFEIIEYSSVKRS